jgi:hypothetical protein
MDKVLINITRDLGFGLLPIIRTRVERLVEGGFVLEGAFEAEG